MKNLFCDYCKKIMKIEETNGGKVLSCTCGFFRVANVSTSEHIKEQEKKGEGVLDGKRKQWKFPHTCPKCNHEGSEVIDLGAAYSDEANVYLFICDKCGYVDRQADGSSNG